MNKDFISFFRYLKKHKLLLTSLIVLSLILSVLSTINILILPEVLFSLDPNKVNAITDPSSISTFNYLQVFKNWMNTKLNTLPFMEKMYTLALIVSLIYIVKNVLDYLRRVMTAWFQVSTITEMRADLLFHLQKLSLTKHEKTESGHFYNLVTSDISKIFTSMKRIFEFLITEPLIIINVLLQVLFISWQLSLLIIAMVPITGLIMTYIGKILKKRSIEVVKQNDSFFSMIKETFSSIRLLKLFNAEVYQQNRLVQNLADLKRKMFRQDVVNGLSMPASELIGMGIVSCILIFGAYLIESGESLTGVDIATILVGLIFIIEPIKRVASVYNEMKVAMVSVKRVTKILDEIAEEQLYGTLDLNEFKSSININIDSFKYSSKDNFGLRNVKFNIAKNETVALVGASGAGKTTVLDVLSRLYKLEDTAISIDDVPLNELSNTSLRELVTVVGQESFLLSDTILNNIKFNTTNVTDSDVIEAAKLANAYDFIMALPLQFDTIIEEGGTNFSGGQKQRISIARAFLKSTPILLLDEATSALDSESEKKIQYALDSLMKNRTVLVIAHRLSTIKNASKIIVMNEGTIVEVGTHAELLAQNGIYKNLYQIQYAND